MDIVLWILAGALVVIGLAGILLPALPGTALILAGLVLGAWIDGFQRVGPGMLVLIGAIGALTYGVDFAAAALGAKRMGASPRAVWGAALGTLLGLPLGLIGIIFGPLIGAILGELSVHRDMARAGKAGVAAWLGFAVGMAVKIALAFTMVALFLAAMFLF
jgi:uncharacterized protein